jgi:TonB-dependent starch-binding outer membrane protein SusC
MLYENLFRMKIKILLLAVLSFALFSDISAQKTNRKIIITGKVTGLYNSPVSEALIMVDGKTTSTKTDSEGHYKIKINPSVSKIGVFTTITGVTEEPVNGRTVINFDLGKMIDSQTGQGKGGVNEEVVNDGYGNIKKGDLSKPVSKSDVSGKEYSSFSSIYEILGTIPGVNVSGSSVTVRGIGSTGSTSPLFVVNGITVSSISGINPSMVQSVEVLKGPAASIYGVQGANGVIIIHTKGN